VTISDDWSGEPIDPEKTRAIDDFNPNDPDIVKVHYDLSGWTLDQRAELSQALAETGLAHSWDGDELVVPESLEAVTDELFDRLETELGPFAVVLGDDEDSTEFGLDEWPERDREILAQSVIEMEIPHRWSGTTIFVARDAESEIDDLLDAVESGELLSLGEGEEPPEGALSKLYLLADRLARDPLDDGAGGELAALHGALDVKAVPYGVTQRTWRTALGAVDALVDRIHGADPDPSDVIGAAQELRAALRPYV
jgi:hypothetical protein